MCPSHNLWFYACKTAWLAPELQVSMGLSPRLCFLHAKQRLWTRITSLYGSQTSSVLLSMQNSVICSKMTSSHGFQPSSVVLCMKNSDFWSRITGLCGSQTSPVVLCLQNSVMRLRLYRSQPLSVFFACKTASFGAELQVSMGPRPHLSFCACTTSCLTSELPVSMGPRPHLWILIAKQRL